MAVLVTTAAAAGALATFLLAPLHPNVRYEVGVKAVSTVSASETFSHRPLAFRILTDRMAYLADAVSFGITSFEVVMRLIALGLAVGASLLLWRGLAGRGVVAPGLHALVAAGAVVFMGTEPTIEPDWMAPIFVIAGTGAALTGHGRRRWPMAVLAGVLFAAAAALKIITLPAALIGLLVLAILDHRQFLRSVLSSVVVGLLFVAATIVWAPWEITWLIDIRSLQPDVMARLSMAPAFLLESAARWPTLMLLPAALVLARRRERIVLAAAALLAAVPVVYQAQYWPYHGATLCVVAAVAVFRALRGRVTTGTGVGVLALVAACTLLSATSSTWRADHQTISAAATLAVASVGIAWALVVRPQPPTSSPRGALAAALATLALLYPAMTPFSAGLLEVSDTGVPHVVSGPGEPSPQETTAREVRRRIGANTPVTYLTFGDWPYFLGNPTSCRYPSPLFLQRTKFTTVHLGTRSYAENLACLDEPTSRWLILDRRWFKLGRAPAELRAKVEATWRCSAGFNIGGLSICPRA